MSLMKQITADAGRFTELPLFRELAQQFQYVFSEFHEELAKCENDRFEKRTLLAHKSQQYFALLEGTLRKMEFEIETKDKAGDLSNMDLMLQAREIFHDMSRIWALCKVLFIDAHTGAPVLPHLITWLKMDLFYQNIIPEDLNVDVQMIWKILRSAILVGQIDNASCLLEHIYNLHVRNTRAHLEEHFGTMIHLLNTMPRQYEQMHSASYMTDWQSWKEQCELARNNQQFIINCIPDYNSILEILCGNEEEIIKHSEAWYSCAVSDLMFVDPTVKFVDLQRSVDIWKREHSRQNETPYDDMVAAVFRNDPYRLFHTMSEETGTLCFLAHLCDLLTNSDCEAMQQTDNQNFLPREVLTQYAGMLMKSDHGTWQLGCEYLKFLGANAELRKYVKEIQHTLETEQIAEKWLRLCLDFGEIDSYQDICKSLGQRAKDTNRLSASLRWFWQAKSEDDVVEIIDKLLSQCEEDQSKVNQVQSLVSRFTDSDNDNYSKLHVLDGYCNLCLIMNDNLETAPIENLQAALRYILFLLETGDARFKMSQILLHRTLSLLRICRKRELIIFNDRDCLELLNAVQELETSPLLKLYSKDSKYMTEKNLNQLRSGINWMLTQV